MSLEFDGWEDIQKTIDTLGDVGKKINTTAFKNSLKEGLKIVQDKAPKAKDGSTNGAEKLRVGKIKRYKSGLYGVELVLIRPIGKPQNTYIFITMVMNIIRVVKK